MDEATMETLVRRLDRLERENRRLKAVGVVALAVMAAVGLMGQATATKVAKVVEAEEFVLRDDSGTARARLGLEMFSDSVGLTLTDRDGRKRLSLGVNDHGSPWVQLIGGTVDFFGGTVQLIGGTAESPWLLTLVDANGNKRMGLGAAPSGSPVLFLGDEEGSFVVSLGPKGPRLELSRSDTAFKSINPPPVIFKTPIVDEPPPSRLALSVTSSGLSLTDQFGIVRARFSLSPDGSPEVKLFKDSKETIWSAP